MLSFSRGKIRIVNNEIEWKAILDITYDVTRKQLSRKKAFHHMLANTLDIGGEYQVL